MADDEKPPGFVMPGSSRAPAGRVKYRTPTRRCWRCGFLPPDESHPIPCPRCGNEAAAPPLPEHLPGFTVGVRAPIRGFLFVSNNPKLWSWILIPLLINLVIMSALVTLGISYLDDISPQIEGPWWSWVDWARTAINAVVPYLVGVLVVLASLLATLLLSGLINAPFYDLLSEKTENVYFGLDDPGRPWSAFVPDLIRSTTAAVTLLVRQVVVLSFLFLLSFTAIGAPLFVAAGAFYTGLALMDITLGRKLYSGGQRAEWGRVHWDLVLGCGVLINLVPVLAPIGIVGATLTYLDHPDKR